MTLTPDSTGGFWRGFEELVSSSEIVVDRPRGASHPRYPELIYPLDYGYLAGTTGGDGDGIDVWLGSGPGKSVTGIACTVDVLKRDAEVKLLVGCSETEIAVIDHFLNVVAGLPCVIVRRPGRQAAP